MTQLNPELPTVLITSDKGAVCRALKLDVYIDDNYDNVVGVGLQSPSTRCYLLNYTYNRMGELPVSVTRINRVAEMFEKEGL